MYAARYADGRRADVRDVSVHVIGDDIRILDGQGALLAVWPASRVEPLRPLPRDFRREPLVLRPLPAGDEPAFARLTMAGPAAARGILTELAPFLSCHRRRDRRRWLVAGVLIWACLAATWVGLPLLSRQLAPLVPPAWEAGLGEQTRRQVGLLLAGTGGDRAWVTLDPAGQRVLDRLVERLENTGVEGMPAAADGAPPLRVHVLKSGVVNAFAVPGSSIIVTTGLLNEIEGLDELAAVLAHERAHVRLRHTTQQLLRTVAFQYLADVLGGGSQVGATAAQYAVTLGWTRDMEREADDKGLETLRAARISPAGFARFFRRLEGEEGGHDKLLALLSTHPDARERAARSESLPPYPVEPLFGEDFWKRTGLRQAAGTSRIDDVREPGERSPADEDREPSASAIEKRGTGGGRSPGPRDKLGPRGADASADKNISQIENR